MAKFLGKGNAPRTAFWQGRAKLQQAGAKGEKSGPPTFSVNAYNGDAVWPESPWWLDAPIVTDLAGLSSPDRISAVVNHERTVQATIGQTTRVAIGRSSIDMDVLITGDVTEEKSHAKNIVTQADNGMEWPVSIGADIEKLEFVDAGASVTVNGKTFNGPVYVLRQGRLFHIAFVSDGADTTASARIAAAAAREQEMDFHEWLLARGFSDPATLNDAQRKALKKDFDLAMAAAEQERLRAAGGGGNPAPKGGNPTGNGNPAPEPILAGGVDPISGATAGARLKAAKQHEISTLVKRYADERPHCIDVIEAHGRAAIADDWSIEKLEMSLIRDTTAPASSVNGAQPGGGSREQLSDQMLEAALCQSMKLQDYEKHFKPDVLEAANRRFRHGASMGEVLELAAQANGAGKLSIKRNPEEVLAAALPRRGEMRASGASTISTPGILSNVANKFLKVMFEAVEMEWRKVAAIRRVNDFKTTTSYSLTGDLEFKQVAPGGEIKDGTLGEQSYTNKADTYGIKLGIDRRDLINDDLGAFNSVLRRLARGAALKFNKIFWATFLNNSSFFTTGRGNKLSSGATTALSLTSLEAAEIKFNKQTDPDGQPLGLMSKLLLVPTDLGVSAKRLMNSLDVRELQATSSGTGDAKTYGTTNPFAGRYAIAASAYLSNTNVHSSATATAWWLLADPQDMPVIEACFLNGVELPTVEQAQADFDTLGIKMRGFFDFGVALQEYRGGVMSPGA